MKSAVTISLVPEARGGPFVFWDDLPAACRQAKELGFDAVEVFPPAAETAQQVHLADRLTDEGLALAAMGTGAGWVKHRLTLTHADASVRQKAIDFVRAIIDAAGPLGAPAIIGSMQGRWGEGVERSAALDYLRAALETLAQHAAGYGQRLIYEPLNRYETNLCNTVAEGIALVESIGATNVVLLADLFHMNIEEVDLAAALRQGGKHVGHVHFVDSNRRPAGCGHLKFEPIVAALREIGYAGYLSAECFPWPDSAMAARQTIKMFDTLTAH